MTENKTFFGSPGRFFCHQFFCHSPFASGVLVSDPARWTVEGVGCHRARFRRAFGRPPGSVWDEGLMKLLLDTHAVLWSLDDPLLQSLTAREAIAEPSNEVLVSAAVCWEIAIKRSLGKLTAPTDLRGAPQSCGFTELDITAAHALATKSLPMHHRDPFDRMLVAQAHLEGTMLVSRDPWVAAYGVPTITACCWWLIGDLSGPRKRGASPFPSCGSAPPDRASGFPPAPRARRGRS